MDTKKMIESGNLELYVYGLLNESETIEISDLAKNNSEIENEILSIEKAILNLSSSFSPLISVENFEKIKTKLQLRNTKVIEMKSKSNVSKFMGWAASIALLFGIGFQYTTLKESYSKLNFLEQERSTLQKSIVNIESKSKQTAKALSVVRDANNTIVHLTGQTIAPSTYAIIYWNQENATVYVDATGLPEPPAGKVYQIWSLKLNPVLTPTSIGLLDNFSGNNEKLFAVKNTKGAEAFGITLEPAGGSKTPTMNQLYTLGKV